MDGRDRQDGRDGQCDDVKFSYLWSFTAGY